jgi:hypothetical protein
MAAEEGTVIRSAQQRESGYLYNEATAVLSRKTG